jgi:hypothetical protein
MTKTWGKEETGKVCFMAVGGMDAPDCSLQLRSSCRYSQRLAASINLFSIPDACDSGVPRFWGALVQTFDRGPARGPLSLGAPMDGAPLTAGPLYIAQPAQPIATPLIPRTSPSNINHVNKYFHNRLMCQPIIVSAEKW